MYNDFYEVDFCLDCVSYTACKESKFDLKLLEQYMILTALNEEECNIEKKINDLFVNYKYSKEEVARFMENKKKDCIYFDNSQVNN